MLKGVLSMETKKNCKSRALLKWRKINTVESIIKTVQLISTLNSVRKAIISRTTPGVNDMAYIAFVSRVVKILSIRKAFPYGQVFNHLYFPIFLFSINP